MLINQEYFKFITRGTEIVPNGENGIYYAETYEYYSEQAFRNFSIKMPLQGQVYYRTKQQEFYLNPNEFLLSFKQPGKVIIESASLVKSLCIDIKQETIIEAFAVIKAGEQYNLENFQAGYFFEPDFFENVYALKKDPLGTRLTQLTNSLINDHLIITEEIFLTLAEDIIVHEFANFKSLGRIDCIKKSTKKEMLKRLLKGKDFIDDTYLNNPCIKEILKACSMTHFNFFRQFKQVFGISPYQYIMKKRLEKAISLSAKDVSFTTIAIQCGFPDVFTFSKAFKRAYGVSPAHYKMQHAKLMSL